MKTRAIRDSRASINTQAPRGVRRRAGQMGVINPGVLVAHVGQPGEESSGTSHLTQSPIGTTPEALENGLMQQQELPHCQNANTTDPSLANQSHQKRMSEAKGKGAVCSSTLNTDLQLFHWNSEGVRAEVGARHNRVILVEENCPSQWPRPTGRMGPISFEDHLNWAKTQIAFGKHFATDRAAPEPVERRQTEENMGFTNEIAVEPVFNSPFDAISASAFQTHHREVDEAFVRMGIKRDANPGWQKNKSVVKRAKSLNNYWRLSSYIGMVRRNLARGGPNLFRGGSLPPKLLLS
ncbi:hypothetical protein GBA52_010731 [Prunus armeniaca]|nr:hypothetical protein GBA52_010731 [Prunus armeniaca]